MPYSLAFRHLGCLSEPATTPTTWANGLPCPACKPLHLCNPTLLLSQRAGYDTYLIGKLLNGFTEASVSAGCPRGWSVLGGWVGGRAGVCAGYWCG